MSPVVVLQVLVPLVLLQRLLLELTRRGDRQLNNLVQFGVSYIEEMCSDYIIQQGGWVSKFCSAAFMICTVFVCFITSRAATLLTVAVLHLSVMNSSLEGGSNCLRLSLAR